ncbi:MAG: hypothetical protein JWO31_3263 [Phycisphaerales bacterium]|nr:hypothetical protein [Phycisphaerales bacterium]
MKMKYRLLELRDPKTSSPVLCRQGPDGIAVPRRHRKGWDRLAPEARANREAERRAARAFNRARHRLAWPPAAAGEESVAAARPR